MGLLDKLRSGLARTKEKLAGEIKRIVTLSPKLDADTLEELEATLIASDLGVMMTTRIVESVRDTYESQGRDGLDVLAIARREVKHSLGKVEPLRSNDGLTVVSVVGVNGTGKTTTCAKLAHSIQKQEGSAILAACDTFRAAALEQLQTWGERLDAPVISGGYGADPAAVAHDAISAAQSRGAEYLFIDTAGRLHTKSNLMLELEKLHRVVGKKLEGAPHEVLLVLDATTGMNALNQAREFHKAVTVSGLVITKLDGTSKGGMIVAIQNELGLPIKYIGLGEQPDDLQPFDAEQFAEALFTE